MTSRLHSVTRLLTGPSITETLSHFCSLKSHLSLKRDPMCTKPGRATFFLWLFFSPLPRCSMNNLLMWPLFFNPKRGGHAEFQTLSSTYLESHLHPCVSSPQVGWPLHGMIHHGWRHSMATLAVWRHYIFWLIRDHVTRHGSSTHFHVSRVPFWYFFREIATHASDFAMASVFPLFSRSPVLAKSIETFLLNCTFFSSLIQTY